MSLPAEYAIAGKTALITGAGRGIGTGIAEVFAEADASVVVNAYSDTYLGPFVEKLAKRTGAKVFGVACDCTTPEGAARLLAAAEEKAGPVDILVNNLGDSIPSPLAPLGDIPGATDEQVRKILDLNLMATIYCTRAAAPGMLRRSYGKVINISSVGAFHGRPTLSLYSAAKAGVDGLTRALAMEWATHGIQVNAIAPGLFPDIEFMGEEAYAKRRPQIEARIPMRRVGRFREVGLLALYLASEASDYMTGQTLSLDGGMTA